MDESFCYCYSLIFFSFLYRVAFAFIKVYIIHSNSHRNISSLHSLSSTSFCVAYFDDYDITFVDIILNDMCTSCVSKQYTRIYSVCFPVFILLFFFYLWLRHVVFYHFHLTELFFSLYLQIESTTHATYTHHSLEMKFMNLSTV